jgi:hypothetical protein
MVCSPLKSWFGEVKYLYILQITASYLQLLLFQIESTGPVEVKSEREPNELVTDRGEQSSEPPSGATHQMRADMGALFPGLPQGSSGNPTLILGGFSLVTMPMVGMNDMLQNILPLLQKLPTPTQVFSG